MSAHAAPLAAGLREDGLKSKTAEKSKGFRGHSRDPFDIIASSVIVPLMNY